MLAETRSKHSGVIAAFNKLVVRAGGVDPAVGALLRSLFVRRGEADYSAASISQAATRRAIIDAEMVVSAVAAWMADRD